MSTTFEDIEKAPPKIDWNWCRDFLAYPSGPGANGRYGKRHHQTVRRTG